ncbi:MAG: hypothetical protein AVDCRST_MAG93-8623, partial [uncultured Chloroflexia bacterium]
CPTMNHGAIAVLPKLDATWQCPNKSRIRTATHRRRCWDVMQY